MLTEKQFEEHMAYRYFQPASSNLAERIIASAQEKKKGISGDILSGFLLEVIGAILPKPAYALAIVLIVGILIGISLPLDQAQEYATTIYSDEAML